MVDVPQRNEEVKKTPICIFQYNMFMKGVDRTDQYLSYYSLEKNSEVAKESCILDYL